MFNTHKLTAPVAEVKMVAIGNDCQYTWVEACYASIIIKALNDTEPMIGDGLEWDILTLAIKPEDMAEVNSNLEFSYS